MTSLYLVLYKQAPIFPQNTAHWALYLENEGAASGTLFHASKESLAGETRYKYATGTKARQSKNLRSAILVKSGTQLTFGLLHPICKATAQGRPFDLVVNNCQRFCSEILVKLVNSGHISAADFANLKNKGFTPLF
ncbi:hypothetical protein FQN49_000601 [Arthroderma sp. PD_2]|nr:hypothetical protein FQN49_000601 [Arthroderma sp. PD_2]